MKEPVETQHGRPFTIKLPLEPPGFALSVLCRDNDRVHLMCQRTSWPRPPHQEEAWPCSKRPTWGSRCDAYIIGEDGQLATLQHVLQLLIGRSSAGCNQRHKHTEKLSEWL